jgi:soluble cytochrome b562
VDETIADLHRSTYSSLRGKCKRYFADLVPGKLIDLIPVSPDMILENGLKFVLLSTDDCDKDAGGGNIDEGKDQFSDGKVAKKSKRSVIQAKSHRSTDELSGGQMALLGLSFVFAAALHKRSPLYLLDEVG